MGSCVAYGCTNHPARKMPGITFHTFPKDEVRRELWIKAIRRANWVPSKHSRLCSMHFPEEMFDRTSLSKVRLRENAIPSVFPAFPSYLQKKPNSRKSRQVVVQEEPSDGLQLTQSSIHCTSNTEVGDESFDSAGSSEQIKASHLKRKIDELSSQLEVKNKNIKTLQQKTRRYKTKINKICNLISVLEEKEFMNNDALEVLSSVSKVNEEFLLRRLKAAANESLPSSYSSELKNFAMTLHFYSPRAYEFVRSTFNFALPHIRTLSNWFQCVDGWPGFTKEAFAALASKIKDTDYQLLFSLIFDEMAIRQSIEFDGKSYHGYVDIGAGGSDVSLPVAKEAFVILIVPINGSFKLPLGYFLINGLTSTQRADLVRSCLFSLHEIGAEVVSLTCDGLSSNISMMKELGCSVTFNDLKITFEHPADKEKKIAVFLDPSLMLKLVRNTIGDKKSLFSEDGMVNWKFIESLHNLQTQEGLHLLNRLRAEHIHYSKQKMKVRLAAQLFSKSVADALEYCKDKLEHPDFTGCDATIKFLLVFNNLFDVLNSRSLRSYGFKKAINLQNFQVIKQFLLKAYDYISGLRVSSNGINLIESNRKTGFLGFLIGIKSYLYLAEKLISSNNPPLIFFSCYNISQDHLELFFSSIRFHGGCNNNPSARQFATAYKRLLVISNIKSSKTGNCIPISEMTLLSVPTHQTPEKVINFFYDDDFNEPNIPEEHDYFLESGVLSECSKDIVYYVAGFVARKLLTTLKCKSCTSALVAVKPPSVLSLICYKTEGGLIYPSEDVHKVCLKCESFFRRNEAKITNLKNKCTAGL